MPPQHLPLATLGPSGTNSEAAAKRYAALRGLPETQPIFGRIEQCLGMVRDGRAIAAVVPAENAIDGLIGSTFDALIEHSEWIHVCDEIYLAIVHVLAAAREYRSEEIRMVYSHSSALNQCAGSLAKAAPNAEWVPVGSTAEAALRVAADNGQGLAAICTETAALAYGLRPLQADLNDYQANRTRFLVCERRRDTAPTGDDRTIFAVHYGRNKPGQLYRTAGALANRGIDLTAVHSRPCRERPGEYIILYETIGHYLDEPLAAALTEIRGQVDEGGGWLIVLGSPPRREPC